MADQRVFQNTPDITGHMGFNLGVPAADGVVDFIGLVSFRSDASQFETPNAFLDQDGFELVDFSIVYADDQDRFSVGGHDKNQIDVAGPTRGRTGGQSHSCAR